MSVYETEEQQVEALKRWWKENGTAVIAGVVIGLGGVFGWQWWNHHVASQNAEAAAIFEQVVAATERGDADAVRLQSALLAREYDATAYAGFAALARARVELDAGEPDAARAALEQAVALADDPAVAAVARLRLARLLLAQGDAAAAATALPDIDGAFAAEVAAVRGDIAVMRDDLDAARTAYAEALAGGVGDASLVRIKLDNLARAQ